MAEDACNWRVFKVNAKGDLGRESCDGFCETKSFPNCRVNDCIAVVNGCKRVVRSQK